MMNQLLFFDKHGWRIRLYYYFALAEIAGAECKRSHEILSAAVEATTEETVPVWVCVSQGHQKGK